VGCVYMPTTNDMLLKALLHKCKLISLEQMVLIPQKNKIEISFFPLQSLNKYSKHKIQISMCYFNNQIWKKQWHTYLFIATPLIIDHKCCLRIKFNGMRRIRFLWIIPLQLSNLFHGLVVAKYFNIHDLKSSMKK
jgi:hypothetical protein